jgi:hypothetical protein
MVRGLPVYKMWKGGERAKGGDPVDRIGISIPAAFRPLARQTPAAAAPPNVHTCCMRAAGRESVRFEPLGMPRPLCGVKKLVPASAMPLCRNNLLQQRVYV